MGVTKDITPVVSPILVNNIEIGKNVFWGASNTGDNSGGNNTFYLLNPVMVNREMYYALDNFGVTGSAGGKIYNFVTNVGSWGEPGLTGPSGTVYIDIDVTDTTGYYAKIKRFERPYYLGQINQSAASYGLYFVFTNENLVVLQVWCRAKIFYAPRLL